MYKIIGIVFIFISVAVFFNKTSFEYYNTYIFLAETASIAEILIVKCSSGQTYPVIFEEISFRKLMFYKTFYFKDGKVIPQIKDVIMDRWQKENAITFFNGLGKRNLASELEYLKENKKQFLSDAQEYKDKYKNRQQSDMLYGISVAVIISIVLI